MSQHSDEKLQPRRARTGRLAVAYDFMLVPGGAEQLTLEVLRHFPEADLVTGFVNRDAFDAATLPSERTHSLGVLERRRGLQAWRTLRAFERRGDALTNFDQVLFSGVYAPAGVRHRSAGGNAYYCHTPPRFAYELEDWYLEQLPRWQRPVLRRLAARVRHAYTESLARMDRIAANSRTVRDRLHRYLGLEDVAVLHPPVATAEWRWLAQEDFYLSNARLEPYKRVAWIIDAFRTLPERRLVIASGGSEATRLRARAAGCDNITFTGWCTPEQLRTLTGRCIATIYLARDEDFGMSPVESMAAGKPVIGMDEGGLRETVVPGETGTLLPSEAADDVDTLRAAVLALDAEAARAMRPACEQRARRFDRAAFTQGLDRFLAAG